MVRLLVKAGANPNERPIGRVGPQTPLMTTAYKDAAVAEALLKAGALLGDSDEEGGLRSGTQPARLTGASLPFCSAQEPILVRQRGCQPLNARDKRVRPKRVGGAPFSIVAYQPLKTSTR